MEEKKEKRRILVPTSRGSIDKVTRVESVQQIMDNAKVVLANEIQSYMNRSFAKGLDPKEARIFNQLVDSLVKLQREERESTKEFDPSEMSEEELLKSLEDIVKAKK